MWQGTGRGSSLVPKRNSRQQHRMGSEQQQEAAQGVDHCKRAKANRESPCEATSEAACAMGYLGSHDDGLTTETRRMTIVIGVRRLNT